MQPDRWRRDRVLVMAAALSVVLFGVLDGLIAGIGICLVTMLRGLSQPLVNELGRIGDGHDFLICSAHPAATRIPGLLILRPEAPLFFGNVERMLGEITTRMESARPSGLVLSLEETPDLDDSSIEALMKFATQRSRAGVQVVLARLKDPVLAILVEAARMNSPSTLLEAGSVDDAVRRLRATLGNVKPVP